MPSAPIPILRTSERTSFKKCQQQWWWTYQDGLQAPGTRVNALWFGIGIHLALQERYKYAGLRRGRNVLKVWRDYCNDQILYVRTRPIGFVDEEPRWVDAQELGEAMLGAYLDEYGKDPRWYVVATERAFEARIGDPRRPVNQPGRKPGRHPLVRFMSRLDLVARDENSVRGDLWIWDHKTASSISTAHLPQDNQAGAYWALAPARLVADGLVPAGTELTGIMYNFLRKAKPDARPRNDDGMYLNKDGSVSKVQPAKLFHREEVTRTRGERNKQIGHIQNEAVQMEFIRDHPSLVTKSPNRDNCGGCVFRDMCSLHESGDDWEEYRDSMFKVVNPYAIYMPSASE